jgi:glycosyltransferase involved in cell wall biosynthesis
VNGWLVEVGSADALLAAILEAASETPKLPEMGQASRRIVEQHFGWTRLAERHIEMYEELLKR